MSIIQGHAKSSGVSAFYSQEIGGSLRFPRSTTSYLSRTFGTPSTNGEKVFTISVWLKRAGNTGNNNYIIDGHTANEHVLAFEGDLLRFGAWAGSDEFNLKTNARKLRDSTAWYHIVCAVDTREAVASDRVTFYINGEELNPSELQGTYPSQNYTGRLNVSGNTAQIGRWGSSTGREFEGYMADFHFIDAQKLSASDFGEAKSGTWIPKAYEGTYGNNGFRLEFAGNTNDTSGNSNNWTAAGGIGTHDYMLDSPTNNFAKINYWPYFGGVLSEADLKHQSNGSWVGAPSTFGMGSGKWYAEFIARDANNISVGVMATEGDTQKNLGTSNLGYMGKYSDSYGWVNNFGTVYKANNDVTVSYGSAPSNDDIIRVAFDADNGELYVGKGATWFNSSDPATNTSPMYSSIPVTNKFYYFASGLENANGVWNFGQDSTFAGATTAGGNSDDNGHGDFKYAVPSGYLALCTANLPTPAADPASDVEPRDYFETFTYSGNDGGQQIGDVIKKPADTTTISNSLVFDGSSEYLSHTTSGTSSGQDQITVSFWIKNWKLDTSTFNHIWSALEGGSDLCFYMAMTTTHTIRFYFDETPSGSVGPTYFDTPMAFTDTSRWYHVHLKVDLNQSTTAEKYQVWVDGVQQTFSYTVQGGVQETNVDLFQNGTTHNIGRYIGNSSQHLGMYLAELHAVDGTAHDPTDFGNFDANGIWIPKTVTGITYGTNGFYLDFSDNTSTTTLGEDQAGSNNWTLNNFATTDQVPDSPTNSYPIISGTNKNSGTALSDGNLEFRNTSGQIHNSAIATQRLPKQGKWYWEAKVITDSSPATNAIGIASSSFDNTPTPSGAGNFFYNEGIGWYGNTGGLFGSATYGVEVESGSATTFGNNDIIGVEYDADEKTMYFRKNGTLIDYHYVNINDSAYDFLPATSAYGDLAGSGTRGNIFNFGQKTLYGTDGAGTLPTGFSLLTEDNIAVNEDNLESPDLVWVKSRDQARHSGLWDSVRGVRQLLQTSSTDLETDRPYGVLDFNKNGFTLQYDPSWHYNEAGQDEVAWCWKAGTSFSNSAGTNDASIASSGSVNTESGFSITTFTATGSNETVAHGLSAKPDMIIIIRRDGSGSDQIVYHSSLGATKNLRFNNSDEARTDSTFFNNTEPTSSVFTIGGTRFADTRTYVAYCFSGKEGYSRFGLYKDSAGSDYNKDSPFIYLGFRPAWILIKSTSTGRAWAIYDNKRTPVNPAYLWLQTSTNTEQSDSTNMDIDFMANGFKVKGGSGLINTTNEEYVFAAFAEMPLKYATAR